MKGVNNKGRNVFIEEVKYSCPICEKKHKVKIYRENNKAIVKKQPVEYQETYYYCPIESEEFYPSKILDKNLLRARDSYRKSNGLLTSFEIKEIRKLYGLNQKEFSNIFGWGDITVQRYESKLIQDETYNEVMRRAKDDQLFVFEELKKHKDKFSNDRFKEIETFLKKIIKKNQANYFNKEAIRAMYIEYEKPSNLNGRKILDLTKVEQMLRFFTQFSPNLYKTKLMKLLWYSDACHYKNYEVSISGLVYEHRSYGAVPIGYNDILDAFSDSIFVKEEFLGYKNGNQEKIAFKIENIKKTDMKKLEPSEITSLEMVNKYFKTMGSKAISDYMHEEDAYKKTLEGDLISFKWSERMNSFDSSK